MIEKANLEEIKYIYNKYMIKDFPDDEIPEYERFLEHSKKELYNAYLYKKNGQNVAYFITVEENNNVLITHLAVIEEFRSKGIGKIFLEEVKEYLANKNILIVEVEAETRANNDIELEIIKRRKKYYTKAEFKQCENMKYVLCNVDYDILIYTPNSSNNYNNIEIKKIIENLYKKLGICNDKLKISI